MSLYEIIISSFSVWRVGILAVVLFTFSLTAFGVAEARTLRVASSNVVAFAPLPQELEGVRVVFIADVHAGPLFGPRRMDDLVERVNALDPDVLILGGDYVGGRGSGAEIFYPRAADFNARVAKLAVLGNHDNWENPGEAKQKLTEAGFTVLENDSVEVQVDDASFAVAGVDDLYTGDPDPEEAARGIDKDMFSILVSHNPDVFADRLGETAGEWNLGLAGHTHGGQVTFFGATAPVVPSDHGARYRTGWRTENGMRILVTNGVGSVTAPLRLFAPPEIQLITLRSE